LSWAGPEEGAFSLYSSLLLQLLMIMVVAREQIHYHTWVAVLGGINILTRGALLISGSQTLNGAFLVMAALNLAVLIMPPWLVRKLTPPGRQGREAYTYRRGLSQ